MIGNVEPLDTRAVAEEHGALRAMARRIRALLEGCQCACGSNWCVRCLCEDVHSLTRRLKVHFRAEEESWSRVEGARSERTTSSWIDRMIGAHGDLSRRLEAASAELEASRQAKRPLPADLEVRVRSILDDLVEHELSETRLFQRSVFENWGRPE